MSHGAAVMSVLWPDGSLFFLLCVKRQSSSITEEVVVSSISSRLLVQLQNLLSTSSQNLATVIDSGADGNII